MNKYFGLDEAREGTLYEIVSVSDEALSHEFGAYQGMSVVILKKALESIVQFGYSQVTMEKELLKKIIVQAVH